MLMFENIIKIKLYLIKKLKLNFAFVKCLLILFGGLIFAQNSQLPIKPNEHYVFSQSKEGYLEIITKNGFHQLKSNWVYTDFDSLTIKNLSKLGADELQINNQNYYFLKDSTQSYLVLKGGGVVYSKLKNSLLRIDNSVPQKNQHGSSAFFYKKKLYMYGGYGFWSFKDYISFFDESTGQWEILKNKSKFFPPGRWKAIHQIVGNKLYVLGGRNNPETSILKDIALNDAFVFDFETKKFFTLDNINPNLPFSYSYGPNLIIDSKKAYIGENQLVLFDFKNKKVLSYFKENLFEGIDNEKHAYKYQDTVYFIKNQKNKDFLAKVSINDIKQIEPIHYEMYVKTQNNYMIPIIVFLFVFMCWTIFKLFSYKDFLKDLIVFDEKGIYYGEKFFLLNEKQIKLIKHLNVNDQISSDELNKIISTKTYAKSHLTLLRSEFIEKLNDIYKKLSSKKLNLVEEVQNPKDNRRKIYRTTRQISEKESFFTFLFKL